MNSSNLCTNLGSSGLALVSGEISIGWPYKNVGSIKVSSTYFSKKALIIWPTVKWASTSMPCSLAKERASSKE